MKDEVTEREHADQAVREKSVESALKRHIFVARAGGVVSHRAVCRKTLANKQLQQRPSRRSGELCDNGCGPRNDSRRSTQDHF